MASQGFDPDTRMAASPTTQDEMERRGQILPNGRHQLPTKRPSAVGTAPAAFGSSSNIQSRTILSSASPHPYLFSTTEYTNNTKTISLGNPSKALPALQAPAMERQVSMPHINNAAAPPYSGQKEAEEDQRQTLVRISQETLYFSGQLWQGPVTPYVESDRHHLCHKETHCSHKETHCSHRETHCSCAQGFQPQHSVTQSLSEEAIGSGDSTHEEPYLTQYKELQQVADQGPGQSTDTESCVDSSAPSTPASSDNVPCAAVANSKGKGVDKPRPYQCPYCNCRPFIRKDHLVRHIRTKHENGVKHRCEECGTQFTRKDNLKQHKQTIHKVEDGSSQPRPAKSPKLRRLALKRRHLERRAGATADRIQAGESSSSAAQKEGSRAPVTSSSTPPSSSAPSSNSAPSANSAPSSSIATGSGFRAVNK